MYVMMYQARNAHNVEKTRQNLILCEDVKRVVTVVNEHANNVDT